MIGILKIFFGIFWKNFIFKSKANLCFNVGMLELISISHITLQSPIYVSTHTCSERNSWKISLGYYCLLICLICTHFYLHYFYFRFLYGQTNKTVMWCGWFSIFARYIYGFSFLYIIDGKLWLSLIFYYNIYWD